MQDIPMASREFEVRLVHAAIHDTDFRYYLLNYVQPEFLNEWDCQYIFKIVVSHHKSRNKIVSFMGVYEAINMDMSLSDEKKESLQALIRPYIMDLSDQTVQYLAACVDAVIPRLQSEIGNMVMVKALGQAHSYLQEGKSKEIFQMFQELEEEIIYSKVSQIEFWDTDPESIRSIKEKTKGGIPLGINGINDNGKHVYLDDEMFYGGLAPGHLGIVLGESKLGKSVFCFNISMFASLSGYNVDHYTLEVSAEYLKLRGFSAITNTITNQMRDGKVIDCVVGDVDKYKEGRNPGSVRIYEYLPSDINVQTIAYNTMKSNKMGRQVHFVVVDYLDLLEEGRSHQKLSHKDKRLRIGGNAIRLRAFGGRYGCAVLSPSQIRRGDFGKKEVTADAISEDISKVFSGDSILILTKAAEKLKDYRGETSELVKYYCNLERNRYGDPGSKVSLDVDMSIGRMFDFEPRVKHG